MGLRGESDLVTVVESESAATHLVDLAPVTLVLPLSQLGLLDLDVYESLSAPVAVTLTSSPPPVSLSISSRTKLALPTAE